MRSRHNWSRKGLRRPPWPLMQDRARESWARALGDVDAVIDCAAICPFHDWEDDGWDLECDQVFSINLGGPINVVRAFMPGMVERNGGSIAMVGSVAGRIGGVAAAPHYVMSKGGVHSFVMAANVAQLTM